MMTLVAIPRRRERKEQSAAAPAARFAVVEEQEELAAGIAVAVADIAAAMVPVLAACN